MQFSMALTHNNSKLSTNESKSEEASMQENRLDGIYRLIDR